LECFGAGCNIQVNVGQWEVLAECLLTFSCSFFLPSFSFSFVLLFRGHLFLGSRQTLFRHDSGTRSSLLHMEKKIQLLARRAATILNCYCRPVARGVPL
jgi:hypothetical protein